MPSRNLTVRSSAVEAVLEAAPRAVAAVNEPNATQSPPNSRRPSRKHCALLKAASDAQARQQIEEGVLAVCRQWLDDLTADAKLEPVPIDVPADVTLASVRERLRAAQDEIVTLRCAPTPSRDIRARIADYVHGLAEAGRPVLSGIGEAGN